MAQRVFDANNKQDIKDLFDILPDWVNKIERALGTKLRDNRQSTMCVDGVFNINWHNETNICRPIDESDWIGTLCWVWDDPRGEEKMMGILTGITKNTVCPYHTSLCGYKNCRPVLRDEVKFVDDAAPGVAKMETGGDIPNDKYLTITADDITIGGESTTEYNGNDIWDRDYCMEYVKAASESFVKEHGASLEELHVVQANNVAGEPVPDAQGKCAWLRCVFNVNGERKLSRWVFRNAYGSVAACRSGCASYCGYNVRDLSGFRAGVFGSVGA